MSARGSGIPSRSERAHRDGRWTRADSPETDQEHPVDAEDHARAGVDRGEPDRRAQAAVAAAQPYSESITQVVHDLAAGGGPNDSLLLTPRPDVRKVGYIVIAADRGLCGAYNSSVIRAAERDPRRRAHMGSTIRSCSSDEKPRATSATASTASTPRSMASRSARRTRTPARSGRRQPSCSSPATPTSSRSSTRDSCRWERRSSSSRR